MESKSFSLSIHKISDSLIQKILLHLDLSILQKIHTYVVGVLKGKGCGGDSVTM